MYAIYIYTDICIQINTHVGIHTLWQAQEEDTVDVLQVDAARAVLRCHQQRQFPLQKKRKKKKRNEAVPQKENSPIS